MLESLWTVRNGARDEIFANCKQYLTVVSEVSFPLLPWFGLLQMFVWNDKLACSAGLFWADDGYVRIIVTAIFVMTKED